MIIIIIMFVDHDLNLAEICWRMNFHLLCSVGRYAEERNWVSERHCRIFIKVCYVQSSSTLQKSSCFFFIAAVSGLAGLLLTMYIWTEYGSNLEHFVVCSIQSHSIKNLRCTRIGLTAREDYTEQVMGTSEARFVLI